MRLGEYEPIAINNSCICCSSIDDLEKALIQEKDAGKTIIIEPTGIADGTALSNLLTKHNIQ
jgi:G3E family GTPase